MTRRTPVVIRGVRYESQAEAALAHNVSYYAVSKAYKYGTLDNVGLGKERPVTIRGVHYSSMTEAAKALGVTVSAIYQAVKRGTEDRIGMRKHAGKFAEESQRRHG